LAARAGIEPMVRFLEACAAAISSETAKTTDALPSAKRDSSTLPVVSLSNHVEELSNLTKIKVAAVPSAARTAYRAKRHQRL
jgi:hypothetical protein